MEWRDEIDGFECAFQCQRLAKTSCWYRIPFCSPRPSPNPYLFWDNKQSMFLEGRRNFFRSSEASRWGNPINRSKMGSSERLIGSGKLNKNFGSWLRLSLHYVLWVYLLMQIFYEFFMCSFQGISFPSLNMKSQLSRLSGNRIMTKMFESRKREKDCEGVGVWIELKGWSDLEKSEVKVAKSIFRLIFERRHLAFKIF